MKQLNKVSKMFMVLFIAFTLCTLFFLTNNQTSICFGDSVVNYSQNIETSKKYSFKEMIERFSTKSVGENENIYLNNIYSEDEFLKIDDLVPTNLVNTSLSLNELTIHASSYTYLDANGFSHQWIPVEVVIENENTKYNLVNSGDMYEVIIPNIQDAQTNVTVTYQCKYIINKDDCNKLLNKAYNDAKAFVDSKIEETQKAIYEEKLNQYNQYLLSVQSYQQNLIQYNLYLEQVEEYEDLLEEYNQYLVVYNQYNQKLEAYNQYLQLKNQYNIDLAAYQKYCSDLATYNLAKQDYDSKIDAYNEKMAIINHQLEVMEAIKLPMTSLERTVYDAVMGETVTTVLGMKEDLSILNAEEDAIDRAGVATVELREIFTQYFAKETDQDKYNFYSYLEKGSCVNYKKIKSNLEELLRCLDKLYRSGRVSEALTVKGKTEKYLILVAQLALICNAISDGDVYNYEAWDSSSSSGNLNKAGALKIDENWTIDGRTIKQILANEENDPYIADTTIKAYPYLDGYPNALVEPTCPTEVAEPTAPTVVLEPVAPTVVNNPGNAPEVVNEPIEPSKVEKPVPYEIPSELKGIVQDYKNGLLEKREELSSDYEFIVTSNVKKDFRNSSLITIEFYDAKNNFICKEQTEVGSYIVYLGQTPIKEKDEKVALYTFSGWAYEDGEKCDLNHVTREGFVYPTYSETLQKYTVSWSIEGEVINETYEYGSLPNFDSDYYINELGYKLEKAPHLNTRYTFSNWDKEMTPVTGDVIYTACFTESTLMENVSNFKVDKTAIEIELTSTILEEKINLSDLIQTYNNATNLKIQNKNDVIIIAKQSLKQLRKEDITSFVLSKEDKGNGEYYFQITFYQNELKSLSEVNVEVSLEGTYLDNYSYLYCEQEKQETKMSSSCVNNRLNFSMNSNTIYHYYPTFTITIQKNNDVDFNCNTYQAKVNDPITIQVNHLNDGKKIQNIYCVNNLMENIEIENNQFLMPASDVYVGINTTDIDYVVRFISDGFTLLEHVYKYNETLILPSNPTKLSDNEYSYEFSGWSPEVKTTVTESMDYIAQYTKTESTLGEIEQRRGKIIPLLIITGSMIILVPTGIIVIVKKRKRTK